MPISHVSLATGPNNYEEMRDFYTKVLAPLGYAKFMEHSNAVIGFKIKRGGPDFWIHAGTVEMKKWDGTMENRGPKTHVAFEASSQAEVNKWYEAAIKAGATSNGAPGERLHYTKGYYAAYVIDPMGNNIEALHFAPLWIQALKSIPYVMTAVIGAGVAITASRFMG